MKTGFVLPFGWGRNRPFEKAEIEFMRKFDFVYPHTNPVRDDSQIQDSLHTLQIPYLGNFHISRDYANVEPKMVQRLRARDKPTVKEQLLTRMESVAHASEHILFNEMFSSYGFSQAWGELSDIHNALKQHQRQFPTTPLYINEYAPKDQTHWDSVLRGVDIMLEKHQLPISGVFFQINVYDRAHYRVPGLHSKLSAERVYKLLTQIKSHGVNAGCSEVMVFDQSATRRTKLYNEYYQAAVEAGASHFYFWKLTQDGSAHPCASDAQGNCHLFDAELQPFDKEPIPWLNRSTS